MPVRPSIRPSLYLSVTLGLLTRKQKGVENQNWCESFCGWKYRCISFQLKDQRSSSSEVKKRVSIYLQLADHALGRLNSLHIMCDGYSVQWALDGRPHTCRHKAHCQLATLLFVAGSRTDVSPGPWDGHFWSDVKKIICRVGIYQNTPFLIFALLCRLKQLSHVDGGHWYQLRLSVWGTDKITPDKIPLPKRHIRTKSPHTYRALLSTMLIVVLTSVWKRIYS